ncbi:MAG: DNA mismatch repair endonuclease MutL [Chitinophagales bacterium]|nr:DNA mismatch repair endonuclease MutL [Chitinophagales bacterium]
MSDIIKLLPDSIANQIAAGEVIQRPASVVKELLENAIDAGSSQIRLIIKDSGKTSIQVIDNGKGMSETDARMSFERHATSKISSANDLFSIRTMGFRGEALASIAAIAHVEMITRPAEEEVGHRYINEGSVIVKSEKVQAMQGTTITVKNLFYNVPARRKFLKSDPVEMKHILDEFHRVSLAHPEIFFSLDHNGNEVYHLPKSNLKQRIVGIFGKNINEKLVPVNEETEVVTITGFTGKPEAARKTAGDQYIFVNNRFIKSHYLNHAVRSAYESLIAKEMFPTYFLFLEINPGHIDINVHPTKTEIKFEDERLIYNYLRVSLRHSLGQYHVGSSLDFDTDTNFVGKYSGNFGFPQRNEGLQSTSGSGQLFAGSSFVHKPEKRNTDEWLEVYKGLQELQPTDKVDAGSLEAEAFKLSDHEAGNLDHGMRDLLQLNGQYIVIQSKSGLMLIDQQTAHERILYEKYLNILKSGTAPTQKELFPRTIEMTADKSEVLKALLPKINDLGFELEDFGHHTFIIHGTPVGLDSNTDIDALIQDIAYNYSENKDFGSGIEENLSRSMATSSGIKRGKKLEKEEMIALTEQLFACKMPHTSPSGRKCYIVIEHDELFKRFNS